MRGLCLNVFLTKNDIHNLSNLNKLIAEKYVTFFYREGLKVQIFLTQKVIEKNLMVFKDILFSLYSEKLSEQHVRDPNAWRKMALK